MIQTKVKSYLIALFLMAGGMGLHAQSTFPEMVDEPEALVLIETALPGIYANTQSINEKMTGYEEAQRQLKVYVHLMELLKTGNELKGAIEETFERIGVTSKNENSGQAIWGASAIAPSVVKTAEGIPGYEYDDELLQEIIDLLSL